MQTTLTSVWGLASRFLLQQEDFCTHNTWLTCGAVAYFSPPSSTQWFPAKALAKGSVSKGG